MIYNIILLVILLVAFLEELYCERRKMFNAGKLTLFTAGLILIVLAGCRFQDYQSDFLVNYKHMIRMKSVPWLKCFFESNVGHAFFRKIITEVLVDPQWYFVITSAIVVGMEIWLFWKYSPNRSLSMILFYTIGLYFQANNITRQAVAVAITLFSIKYIVEQSLWKYMLTMLLAVSFHSSAVFFVPMYFLSKISFRKEHLYLYTVFGGIALILRNQIIWFFQLFIYRDYSGNAYGVKSSNPLRLLLVLVIVFYLVLLIQNKSGTLKQISQRTVKGREYLYNFMTHGTILYILLSFFSATTMLIMSRLALYWEISALLTVVYAVEIQQKRTRTILELLILATAIAWFLAMSLNGKLIPTPYTPFWQFSHSLIF